VSCCERRVAMTGDSSGTQRKGDARLLGGATKQRLLKTWLWTLLCLYFNS
jgi:hypothetical protein